MQIFSCLKKEFIYYVDNNIISNKVYEAYKKVLGRKSNLSQIKSWANSLPKVKDLIINLPDNVGISIEYGINGTDKRIDIIISGYNKDKMPVLILLELKQWEIVWNVKGQDAIVKTQIKQKIKNTLHPSYQVLSYYELLNNYNQFVEENKVLLIPLVYLHNYQKTTNDILLQNKFKKYFSKAPIYDKNEKIILQKLITQLIIYGDNLNNINGIDNSKTKANKKLLEMIENVLNNKKTFKLLDEQKIIMEAIIQEINNSFIYQTKKVIIVKGAPGTGKSVLALQLLGELLKMGLLGSYISKNMDLRNVYKNCFINNYDMAIKELFKSSSAFIFEQENKYNFLLVDEAQRLHEKSGIRGNLGENQIKEIINACLTSVFFVDEKQIVTLKDIGTINNILLFAHLSNAQVLNYELTSQHRCNGCKEYIDFIDNLLENKKIKPNFTYDFQVIDSPFQLRELIKQKNTQNNARIVAGYCWKRNAKEADNQDFADIVIDDFTASWNLKHALPFATRNNAINEIGCIHNVQGLEFDYIGVIIGPDLLFKNGFVLTDYTKRANTEKSLYGLYVLMKKDKLYYEKLADTIIRNTYRVLLTRGIKGCYVYACDKNLQTYLKKIAKKQALKN